MSELEAIFLGSGTSHGIPMIGCRCPVCTSTDPRDKRFRTCLAVRLPAETPTHGQVILIDMSPEFRLGALATGLERVDAILFTHGHADHIMGIDDIRRFNDIARRRIDCYSSADTVGILRRCFGYTDREFRNDGWPSLAFHEVAAPTNICGARVTPIHLLHGRQPILGFRMGQMAYCTDCSEIPSASEELLAGLDVLILDGLRISPHPTHFNLDGALREIERLRPKRAILTHIAHEIGHAAVSAKLPPNVELAYDSLRAKVAF